MLNLCVQLSGTISLNERNKNKNNKQKKYLTQFKTLIFKEIIKFSPNHLQL